MVILFLKKELLNTVLTLLLLGFLTARHKKKTGALIPSCTNYWQTLTFMSAIVNFLIIPVNQSKHAITSSRDQNPTSTPTARKRAFRQKKPSSRRLEAYYALKHGISSGKSGRTGEKHNTVR